MTRLFESKKVFATTLILFALSVLANMFASGSLPRRWTGTSARAISNTWGGHLVNRSTCARPDPREQSRYNLVISPGH
jgi:hypothetical protein